MPKTFKEVRFDQLTTIMAISNISEKKEKLAKFIKNELELLQSRPNQTEFTLLEAARRAEMAINIEHIPSLDEKEMPSSATYRR